MSVRIATFLAIGALSQAFGATWPPVDPAELAEKTASVEKDAHAEILLWETWVSDTAVSGYPHTTTRNYLRIKIFDQRGVEMMSKVEIPYSKGTSISEVAARTTKANGEVIELKKDAVFDQVVAKTRGRTYRARSFALPGLEPGAVIEYGWRAVDEETYANYVELDLQREIPVRLVRYHLHPLQSQYFPYTMRYTSYQAEMKHFKQERDGYYVASWSNMPAFHEEVDMPARRNVMGWLLVYYSQDDKLSPDKYWREVGKGIYTDTKASIKISGDIKEKAAALTEGATTDEEKAAKLFAFCQTKMRNVNGAHSTITPEERYHFKPNKTTADTLKQGMGTGFDINLLFIALANSAGLDARMARASDRSFATFTPDMANSWFMQADEVAVQIDGKWRLMDPASGQIPYGMLRWQEEGTFALISDPKELIMMRTPVTPASKSVLSRTGTFTLSEDGQLEGDVAMNYGGHFGVEQRHLYLDETEEQISDDLTKDLKSQYGNAEVTNIHHANSSDGSKTVTESYHIKIPDYAQRTGKRLFLCPSVFQKGVPARYTASERKYAIQFSYPWSEVDQITIKFPEGFELDHADMPAPLELGEAGHFRVKATYTAAKRLIGFSRDLVFLQNGTLQIPKTAYPTLKTLFDQIHADDEHALTLKQSSPAAPAASK
jgi:hypothetical protein